MTIRHTRHLATISSPQSAPIEGLLSTADLRRDGPPIERRNGATNPHEVHQANEGRAGGFASESGGPL